MNRLRQILHWFCLTDLGLAGTTPLAVLHPSVVAEAEQILRDWSS